MDIKTGNIDNQNNKINQIKNHISINNSKIRHNHTHTLTSINSNNIIYELNHDSNNDCEKFNNKKINNFNGNNNFLYFSNDKERSNINNKSYGNLRLNNNIKEILGKKNIISFNNFKIKKSISPIQELKKKFN